MYGMDAERNDHSSSASGLCLEDCMFDVLSLGRKKKKMDVDIDRGVFITYSRVKG